MTQKEIKDELKRNLVVMYEPQEGNTFRLTDEQFGFNVFPDGQIQPFIRSDVAVKYCYIVTRLVSNNVLVGYQQTKDLLETTANLDTTSKREFSDFVIYKYGGRSDKDFAGDYIVHNTDRWMGYGLYDHTIYLLPHNVDSINENTLVVPAEMFLDAIDAKGDVPYDGVIYPDKSASERSMLHTDLGIPSFTCVKERDQLTGEIVRHDIPNLMQGSYLVVDDICDGGRTFVDIVTSYSVPAGCALDLFVTHGVFSNNALDKLFNAGYNRVITTDSYQDFEPRDGLVVIPVFKQQTNQPNAVLPLDKQAGKSGE